MGSRIVDVVGRKSEKAPSSMFVTLSGIVTEVKPLQPAKTSLSMRVTLFGMMMESRLLRYSKVPKSSLVMPWVDEYLNIKHSAEVYFQYLIYFKINFLKIFFYENSPCLV